MFCDQLRANREEKKKTYNRELTSKKTNIMEKETYKDVLADVTRLAHEFHSESAELSAENRRLQKENAELCSRVGELQKKNDAFLMAYRFWRGVIGQLITGELASSQLIELVEYVEENDIDEAMKQAERNRRSGRKPAEE